MSCERCQATQNTIVKTTPGANGAVVRRRVCCGCQHRWDTIELRRTVYDTIVTMLRTQQCHTDAMLAQFGWHTRLVRNKRKV